MDEKPSEKFPDQVLAFTGVEGGAADDQSVSDIKLTLDRLHGRYAAMRRDRQNAVARTIATAMDEVERKFVELRLDRERRLRESFEAIAARQRSYEEFIDCIVRKFSAVPDAGEGVEQD